MINKNKILNPKTNRYVNINGKIGKNILAQQKLNEKYTDKTKDCEKNKILNPNTNRCVSIDGKIGKSILAQKEIKPLKEINNISIVTANIFELALCDTYDKKINLVQKLIKNKPNFVCIQESNTDFIDLMKKFNYSLIATNSNLGYELIHIYKNNNCNLKFISYEKLNTNYCNTPRTDIIITIEYKNKQLKIGVVHLCGGTFDELVINNPNKSNINTFKKIKIEIIEQMINKNVDIILGDFNSDFEYFLGTHNQRQINYLKSNAKFDDEQIKLWNAYIYEVLNKHKYKPICHNKCKKLYEKHHTSIYEISPDVIYYKNTNLTIKDEYEIINLIHDNYSDHNAIYANFKLK